MRCRDGFTLIEVLVALVIGGLVLAGMRAIFEALADSSRVAQSKTVTLDQRANGVALLYRLTERLDAATPGATPFFGTPGITEFSSWCEVPHGWLEPCRVVLTFDTLRAEPALVARLGDSTRIALVRGFTHGTFRYLESAENGGIWQRVWGRGTSAPVALGVIIDRDTLIVPVGERG